MPKDGITILIHSSKTMVSRQPPKEVRLPILIQKTRQLHAYLATLSPLQLAGAMHISAALANKTRNLIAEWSDQPDRQTYAVESFVGDIYSGLRAYEFTKQEKEYADASLRILSGLYGYLRPYDGICPYRLEMGYTFPDPPFKNLYMFWKDSIARQLPLVGYIVNVSSAEYMHAVLPFIDTSRVIAPQFLTIDPKTREPTFKAVHAKIARGAFARWLIKTRITHPADFQQFRDLGYHFDKKQSTLVSPTFICETFEGKGLSVRLR